MNQLPDAKQKPEDIETTGGKDWVAVALLLFICCAAGPLLAAGGLGFVTGLLTGTGLAVLVGLALMVAGAVLLWRRWER